MRQARYCPLIFLLLFFSAFTLLASEEKEAGEKPPAEEPAEPQEVLWCSYDEGLTRAEQEDKHVFIDFTAKWCGYCRKMERETFADPKVIELLNNYFVPVKVNGDSKNLLDIDGYTITERNLARVEFRIRGYPTFWFLKPDGAKLGNIRGYRPPDFMLSALAYVKDYKYDTTRTEGSEGGK